MKHIRIASKEEIEAVRAKSHFTPDTAVYAFDQNPGEPDVAVLRLLPVLDPVFFGRQTNDVQKARFWWGLEERMAGSGIPVYYFNVPASDERYQKVVESWGAIRVSGEPEVQFKRELYEQS